MDIGIDGGAKMGVTGGNMELLLPFLDPHVKVDEVGGLPSVEIARRDEVLEANAYYFGKKEWMEEWLAHVHRYPEFRERWDAVAGRWDGKVVVDLGCGPGNLLKSLGGRPRVVIGVDVARGSLEMAAELGMCRCWRMCMRCRCGRG